MWALLRSHTDLGRLANGWTRPPILKPVVGICVGGGGGSSLESAKVVIESAGGLLGGPQIGPVRTHSHMSPSESTSNSVNSPMYMLVAVGGSGPGPAGGVLDGVLGGGCPSCSSMLTGVFSLSAAAAPVKPTKTKQFIYPWYEGRGLLGDICTSSSN